MIQLYSFACKYLVVLNILFFFFSNKCDAYEMGKKTCTWEIREVFFNM